MKMNDYFVILFFFKFTPFSYYQYKSYKLSYIYRIWKAESSFTGFGLSFTSPSLRFSINWYQPSKKYEY